MREAVNILPSQVVTIEKPILRTNLNLLHSIRYSSGEDDEDDIARRKSNKITVSPLSRIDLPSPRRTH
jgi:hypothetical protein